VSPAALLIPIPSGIDLAGAAPLMCGVVSVYTALKRADINHGQWVVVSGAGGELGHLAVQYARALDARVVAIDLGPKKELCLQCGAEAFVDFTEFAEDSNLASHI
jgi:alcohol dehydrogenase, propanol-preferring